MSSKQLGKLEKLAGKRVDRSRRMLEREQQQLGQIEHHRTELHSISQEYQQALIGKSNIAPQQLAYRRAFVEQLTQKLDELAEQRELKREAVKAKSVEFKLHTAQHSAIEVVGNHQTEKDKLVASKRQQQQLDEVARNQYFEKNRMNKESDNE